MAPNQPYKSPTVSFLNIKPERAAKIILVERTKRRAVSRNVRPTLGDRKEESNGSPSSPNSAATEISAQPSPQPQDKKSFEQLLADCDAVAGGQSVIGQAHDGIRRALIPAFPLYCAIKSDKSDHVRLVAHLKERDERQRTSSLKKPAVNAVSAACHPADGAEQKVCSDWAYVIILADLEKVSEPQFASWVINRGIAESKRKVRELRSNKGSKDKPAPLIKLPFREDQFPLVAEALASEEPGLRRLIEEAFQRMEAFLRGPADPRPSEGGRMRRDLPFSVQDSSS